MNKINKTKLPNVLRESVNEVKLIKITKSKLREIIREEIQSIKEGGMGILDSDQADILQAIVMRNKSKPTRTILNLALKSGHFKGVDKKELLGYIDGARQFVKYMKSHPINAIKEISGIDLAKKVVKNKQYEKGMDLFTAQYIVQTYDAYKNHPELRKKIEKLSVPKAVKLANLVMKGR